MRRPTAGQRKTAPARVRPARSLTQEKPEAISPELEDPTESENQFTVHDSTYSTYSIAQYSMCLWLIFVYTICILMLVFHRVKIENKQDCKKQIHNPLRPITNSKSMSKTQYSRCVDPQQGNASLRLREFGLLAVLLILITLQQGSPVLWRSWDHFTSRENHPWLIKDHPRFKWGWRVGLGGWGVGTRAHWTRVHWDLWLHSSMQYSVSG